jgi:hypothetical protein
MTSISAAPGDNHIVKSLGIMLLSLAACGRLGFDPTGRASDGSTSGDDTLTTEGSNVAFVTSFLVVPGNIGGVTAADTVCTNAASAAGLSGPFVAFLSSDTSHVADRLGGHRGWKRPDGLPITDTVADLAGGVRHMVNMDERGNLVLGVVAVATATNATAMLDASQGTCGNWTVASATSVVGGRPDATSSEFANKGFFATCDMAAHLFCFGIRSNTPLDNMRVQGRIAFVSAAGWKPGGGRAAADAHCMSEATAAGLPGIYLALLPTNATSSAARFDLNGPAWVRVDGARVAATPTALMSQRLDTTLNLTASATPKDGYVWTGYGMKDALSTGESTCNDWTSSSSAALGSLGDSRYGSGFLNDAAEGGNAGLCSATYPLYCLQK